MYECENCSYCPLRTRCTKAKESNNRKIPAQFPAHNKELRQLPVQARRNSTHIDIVLQRYLDTYKRAEPIFHLPLSGVLHFSIESPRTALS
ncbi:hypothetical protein AB1K91_01290 [Terribacillus sp. 179-K 1B1 HS]